MVNISTKFIKWFVLKPIMFYYLLKRYLRIIRHSGKEEPKVTDTLKKIKEVQLTPREQMYYGLSQECPKQISEKVLLRLAVAIEKNKEALEELRKY